MGRKKWFRPAAYALLFLLVLILGAVIRYASKESALQKENQKQMEASTLPVLYTYLNNKQIGEFHGYTTEMDCRQMRDKELVICHGKTVNITIDPDGQSIVALDYELIDPKTDKAVKSGNAPVWDMGNGKLACMINAEDADNDTEYYLHLKMQTESSDIIHYYTLFYYQSNSEIVKHLNFIEAFSNATFDKEKANKDIVPYIEPSASNANNDFGKVDITSSFDQITYQDLNVKRVTEPTIEVNHISDWSGTYTLKYQVEIQTDNQQAGTYNVREHFTVCRHNGTMYLLGYQREMDKIFSLADATSSHSRINLGISSSAAPNYVASDNTKYIAFAREGSLYEMDIQKNRVTELFSAQSKKEQSVKDDQYGIRVLQADDAGNVVFMVYGYMYQGSDEGDTGIAIYHYDYTANQLKKTVFIEIPQNYEMIGNALDKMCYVNKDQMMYLYLNQNLYLVDMKGGSYSEIVSNVNDNELAVSSDNSLVAWRENNNLRVLDLTTGKEHQINGKSGEYLEPLGFINHDFVYGTADPANVFVNTNGEQTVLMSKAFICDENGKVIKDYSKKGRLILSAESTGNQISLQLAVKKKQGSKNFTYEKKEQDQIVSNESIQDTSKVIAGSATDDNLKLQQTIEYNVLVTSTEQTAQRKGELDTESKATYIKLVFDKKEDANYYAYAYGKMQGVYKSLSKAKAAINSLKGFVIDGSGKKVYQYQEKFKQ